MGDDETLNVSDAAATKEEMKVLHTLIKKVTEDIEKLSFNTCISAFMVAANEMKEFLRAFGKYALARRRGR